MDRRAPPADAWDCHVHVFGDAQRYALHEDRRYTPLPAGPAALCAHLDGLGLARAVLVQPSPYGQDHACLLDTLAALEGRALGVCAFDAAHRYGDGELDRLYRLGVRGMRIHVVWLDTDTARQVLRQAADQLHGSGLHLEVQIRQEQWQALLPLLETLTLPVVFDHFGGIGDVATVSAPLWHYLEHADAYVKLSAPYRVAAAVDQDAVARALARHLPGRCLFGSDWPHTNHPPTPAGRLTPVAYRVVDDATLLSRLLAALPPATATSVLVDNPRRLYARREYA